MKKIISDKIVYLLAILAFSFIGWLVDLGIRVSALEASDKMGEYKIDSVDKKVSKILCILGEKSEC